MDLALAVLVLWGLLFVPPGMVLHWLVLGEGSRVRALPLAPITGVAAAVAVLATLGRFGIDAGDAWVPWAFVAVAAVSVIVIWRCKVEWRSRELLGAGGLILLAVMLVQLPVVGDEGDGPLGSAAFPVAEVAAIDAAADGPASERAVADQVRSTEDERAIGFEQFAALTVSLGLEDNPEDARAASWTAYGLHATITGMLVVLITLPLFAFARARGVKWLGLVALVPLGVLAPAVFLALANGEGAAIASVAFTTSAVFSLLVTRRDRGWWALVVLFGAAIAATAGPMGLLPLLAIGISWMLLRSDTYEHLSQHDAPVATMRTLLVTATAATLGGIAVIPIVASGGELLSWSPLHESVLDTVRSWPFAWLDSDLSTAGPDGPVETAIWLIGPALLAVAVIYAIVRNERRELGVLVGAIVAALLTAGIALIESSAGIRLFEFTMLSVSPFLAALAIRAVALARENAEEQRGTPGGRFAGVGPSVLVLAFVVLSFAATAVTGTRMVHAPPNDVALAAPAPATGSDKPGTTDAPTGTIIAAGDPWLEFIVDGLRVPGGYADADAISEERNSIIDKGIRTTGVAQVVLSSSPLSSDPGLSYIEQAALDRYQVRLFAHRESNPAPSVELDVDAGRLTQRALTETSDRPGTEGADRADADANVDDAASETDAAESDMGEDAASAKADASPTRATAPEPPPIALVHHATEGLDRNTPPDLPAGLLLPAGDVEGCESTRDPLVDAGTCEPDQPVRGDGCTDADVAAARAVDDRDRGSNRDILDAPRPQVLEVDADDQLPRRPPMIGVQCFDVALAQNSSVLLVHLRDIGLILPPQDADARGPSGAWDSDRFDDRDANVLGGVRRTTSELDATMTYGNGSLGGGLQWDLVLEGTFGAGVSLSSGVSLVQDEEDPLPATELGTLRGSADGFSSIIRRAPLSGSVTVTNDAGTDIELGRLFARPQDLPRSCDVLVGLAPDEHREVRLDVRSLDGGAPIERPGLTVTVVDVTEDGNDRRARVVVGSYLSRGGLPRYTLVDWTEQFEGPTTVEGCDGADYEEAGPDRGDDVEVVDADALENFATGEDGQEFQPAN